jgi:hypothetical protein
MEAPLRATMRITVPPASQSPTLVGRLDRPVGETPQRWLAVGLHWDFNEAFRAARPGGAAYARGDPPGAHGGHAYLSAASDFVVSQVVDDAKGVPMPHPQERFRRVDLNGSRRPNPSIQRDLS